mgnify:CR=1 FL=1
MFTHIDIPELRKIIQKNKIGGLRYYETPEGNEYPSVTTILGAKEKPHLDRWRKMLGEDKAAKETKRCADRGTAVHEMAEKFLNNDPEATKGYKPVYVGDFNKLRFALNKIDNIRSQEVGLYSDTFKYAGTVDCVAEYMGVPSVIDFKTSTNNKTFDMVQDYFKQCTAYALAWEERTGELIEDIVVLIAVEKGLTPLVFKEKIENWIPALLEDIDKFNVRYG